MNRLLGLALIVVLMVVALFGLPEAHLFPDARTTMTFGFLFSPGPAYLLPTFIWGVCPGLKRKTLWS